MVTLDNGLTIIVREDHSAPVVSVQAWAKTGSIHEGEWLGAGLSHILCRIWAVWWVYAFPIDRGAPDGTPKTPRRNPCGL